MAHDDDLTELNKRLRRLEDESAITRLVMSYGPAADAGLTRFAGQLWSSDGEYDWDANGTAFQGSAGVDRMLQGDAHQSLIAAGVAHFTGPLLIELGDDTATALSYSMVMRREGDRFYLWRVSAVRWDLTRGDSGWRVQRRTNRLLDETGAGREFFADSLTELFAEAAK
ncbi:nuclear transport factor 2 family protein [Mycobacterium sp. UM_CSW]|uniref:nuclear transport factor 2 family protein n=1 Tax=Mycobacterium sp. UM_CSW TaxID=1370119 RepID=UPI000409C983|nr:nuclear transport factor 2 family protein [Mycobacterium sp. UM_CSW]